jgi:hypothetical protein
MAKAGKKAKRIIPKRIAGVRVPRAVRKGRFGDLLASKTGQALIAQAILGAGAVAAGMKVKDSPKVREMAQGAKDKIADVGQDATRGTAQTTSTLAYALGEAAKTFAEALRRGEERSFKSASDAESAWTPDYGAPAADETRPGRPGLEAGPG